MVTKVLEGLGFLRGRTEDSGKWVGNEFIGE